MPRNVGLACNITTGKLDANQAVKGGEYPFFTCAQYPDTIDSYAFDDDVVLVAGNNAQGNFHVSRFKGKFNAYQRTYVLTAKAGCNIDYIYYALKLELKRLRERSQGSQTKFLTMPILTGIHLKDLGFDEQSKIAKVLTSIDTKIKLNNRINAELEAMAKTLYDYWFVQFDFPFDFAQGKPDANGKPYKSSGGRMVYNPTLKREIPVGWEATNVQKVANLLGGGTPTKTKPEFWNGDIPFFTPSDSDSRVYSLKTEDYITLEGLENSSTKLFPRNTVFITARGSVGRLALNAVPMTMNQSCYALQAKEDISYTYLFFLTKELIQHLEVKASGSVFNSIVSNDIEYTNLAIPISAEVIKVYAKIAEPLFKKIEIKIKENSQLEQLRDWLLPMLMNGQVTVKQ
ncbi:restriction endonuclease subunit S [Nitrosomonas sp. Nm58]|uniref:restriction endonuclease subunit S n=1 Tax=Nitrosomonas sp. Nm58 TaxID=200126 RepID=UPI00089A505A|nr:restriction endonuclease subunit S [Nitrosomonas sp. Nm58]SDY00355.1 type I restriction enzyme, S subunit [Nitrosomonas sp. Nm58]